MSMGETINNQLIYVKVISFTLVAGQFEVTSKKKVTLMNILFGFLCQSV